jgi:hypothetical protein
LSSFGTLTHGLPALVMIRTPPVVPLARPVFSLFSAPASRSLRSVTNWVASNGLASAA